MAQSCTPQDLADLAKCLTETLSSVELQAARIYLWCAFLNGATVDCSPQNLATQAECLLEKLDRGQLQAVETSLACLVASGGGGGGGGSSWTHGAGTPIALGISTTTYGTFTNDNDSTFWTVSNGSWIPLV